MKKMEFGKEAKQDLTNRIREFFRNERDEEISDFQAGAILEFIAREIGPYIYNQAIADAHAFMAEKIEDLYGLEQRPR
jgi:Uncharacterized conserved protein